MWQRRALQAELGTCDALIQLSLSALKRYSAAQSTPASPVVTFSISARARGGNTVSRQLLRSSTAAMLPPGAEWGLETASRSVSVSSLTLIGLDRDPAGNARARWSIGFSGSDVHTSSYGKLLFGGIRADTPLGELVQEYEGMYGGRAPGLISRDIGKPVTVATNQSTNGWNASAELITLLAATVNPVNGSIAIKASLVGATIWSLTSASFDAAGDTALQADLSAHLDALLAGRIPDVFPPLSALGALSTNDEVAAENLPTFATLRAAGTTTPSVLCIFLSTNAAAIPPATSTDLTAGADSAFVVSEAGIRRTIAFCFRTGRFPTHWATITVEQAISNGSVSVVSSQDIDSVSITLVPYAANSARQEDGMELRFTTRSTITDVRNPDSTPADPSIKPQLTAGAVGEYSDTLYFSNVGTPSPKTDPQVEAWFQAWRAQVSRRFSIPFSAPVTATLLERSLNGVEKLMLSRTNHTF